MAKPAVWSVDPVEGLLARLVFSDAMLNSSNSRHVRFVSPYVILHFGSTTHIPAYSKDIIWSFLIPCERIIRVLRRLLRPAWSLTLSHTVIVGRPGNEACPTRPDTCSIYILYPSWSHTSKRNINSTFELHDGLKPIYARILVVLSRPTARSVSDILVFFVIASLSLYGHSQQADACADGRLLHSPTSPEFQYTLFHI